MLGLLWNLQLDRRTDCRGCPPSSRRRKGTRSNATAYVLVQRVEIQWRIGIILPRWQRNHCVWINLFALLLLKRLLQRVHRESWHSLGNSGSIQRCLLNHTVRVDVGLRQRQEWSWTHSSGLLWLHEGEC